MNMKSTNWCVLFVIIMFVRLLRLMTEYNFKYKIFYRLPLAWNNRLQGLPAIVIGGGGSVNKYKIFLEQNYKKFITIGINRIFTPYIKIDPSFLMWQDESLHQARKDLIELQKLKSIKFSRSKAGCHSVPSFNFNIDKVHKKPLNLLELTGMGSSGHLACQIAYLLGCSPIVVLGLDGRYDKKTDFYGDNPYYTDKDRAMKRHQKGIKWFFKFAVRNNIDLINLSANGKPREKPSEQELYDKLYVNDDSRQYIWNKLYMFNEQKCIKKIKKVINRRIK